MKCHEYLGWSLAKTEHLLYKSAEVILDCNKLKGYILSDIRRRSIQLKPDISSISSSSQKARRQAGIYLSENKPLCVNECLLMSNSVCDLMDCSPPGSPVHGLSQTRILDWVSISFSRGSSPPRIKLKSPVSPALASEFFTTAPPGKPTLSPTKWMETPRGHLLDMLWPQPLLPENSLNLAHGYECVCARAQTSFWSHKTSTKVPCFILCHAYQFITLFIMYNMRITIPLYWLLCSYCIYKTINVDAFIW